jgi:hypothetical protein
LSVFSGILPAYPHHRLAGLIEFAVGPICRLGGFGVFG